MSERAGPTETRSSPTFPLDVAFPVDFADEIARLEAYNKHHYRPNSYLHKWWARRCGSTFRLILKQLVRDEDRRDYYAPGGLEGRIVLDPMMGGGTTLHEAIRLGANVIGADLDPIPILQVRAALTQVPMEHLEAAFRTLCDSVSHGLGSLFSARCPQCAIPSEVRYVLHGNKRACACGPKTLVDSLVIRYERRRPFWRVCAYCRQVIIGDGGCACRNTGPTVLVEKRHNRCDHCHESYQEDWSIPYFQRYEPIAVISDCPEHGMLISSPTRFDRAQIEEADRLRSRLRFRPADFAISAGPKSRDLKRRGVDNFLDLFSSRQLIYLDAAHQALSPTKGKIRLNLALLVSTSLEFNSLLCGYKGARKGQRPGAIRHTFSHHAYSFPYTAVENNPLQSRRASGTVRKLFHDRIRRARNWALAPRERVLDDGAARFTVVTGETDLGEEVASADALKVGSKRFYLHQGSSNSLPLPDGIVDFVVTDPPFYDSLQYSDLAAFFRVWLRSLTQSDVKWNYDTAESAVATPVDGDRRYEDALSGIFSECSRLLRPGSGRLVFTFHSWKPEGWIALTLALKTAGFELLNRYIVHSENPVSVHIANLRALTHDAILVLASRGSEPSVHWRRPPSVRTESSANFCHDCATLLGWLLESDLPTREVRHTWQQALAG